MKIRSGFVSNSSSSSFVFVGFPATEIRSEKNYQEEVKKELPTKTIDSLACKFFDSDADYEKYRKGVIPEAFWKYVYDNEFDGEEWDSPDGLDTMTGADDEVLYGKRIARVEYGTVEFTLEAISDVSKELIKKYPGVTPKAYLSHSE